MARWLPASPGWPVALLCQRGQFHSQVLLTGCRQSPWGDAGASHTAETAEKGADSRREETESPHKSDLVVPEPIRERFFRLGRRVWAVPTGGRAGTGQQGTCTQHPRPRTGRESPEVSAGDLHWLPQGPSHTEPGGPHASPVHVHWLPSWTEPAGLQRKPLRLPGAGRGRRRE